MHSHSTRKRLAVAARVSTTEQEEHGTSLDDQIAKGRLLAQLHDYSVDDRPYQEGGLLYSGDESGSLPLAQRPIMTQLLADARLHKFDAVCFARINRIARRLKYILAIWDALDEAGVAVLVIDPPIDTSTPIGRLIRNVLGSVAEFERDSILETTMGGRRRKLARGELFLPCGKYGYSYKPIDRANHTPGRVTINQTQAAVVVRIYQRRAKGVSYERLAAELTADGIPSPAGNPSWMYTTVRRIVSDPAYKGEGRWGFGEGKCTWRPRRDGRTPIPLAFPPIVSPEEWADAQAAGGRACIVRAPLDRFLLRGGLVHCRVHDHTMTGASQWQYRCTRLLPTGKRTSHSVPSRALDDVVWAEVRGFLLDPSRGLAAAREQAQRAEQRLEEVATRRIAVQQRLAKLEEQGAYLLRLARETSIAPAKIEASLGELAAEEEQLRRELPQLEAQAALARAALPKADEIARTCQRFAQGAQHATIAQRRAILDALEVQVVMSGADYEITGVVPELERTGTLAVQPDRASTHRVSTRCTRARRSRIHRTPRGDA